MEMKSLAGLILFALLKHAGGGCYAGSDPPLCDDCGGFCDSSNGCYCFDITQCVPTSCIMDDNTCCPVGYYWSSSSSCCTDVFACNPQCAADQQCVKINQNAVCECKNDAYIGKTIADVKPTVQCDHGTLAVLVSKCLLTYLGYDYTSLHLRDKSRYCSFHYPHILNDQIVETVQARAQEGWCGTTATITKSKIYYTNTLYIDPLPSNIATDPLAKDFTCGYNLTMQTRLLYTFKPSISVTVLPPERRNDLFYVYTAAYKDSEYTDPWQDGESIRVGSDIFLAFSVPDADGTYFTLRVDECFAAPAGNSNDKTTINLVRGGCAVTGQCNTKIISNGESLEARIRIKAFQSPRNPPKNLTIVCKVSLCVKSAECKQCKK